MNEVDRNSEASKDPEDVLALARQVNKTMEMRRMQIREHFSKTRILTLPPRSEECDQLDQRLERALQAIGIQTSPEWNKAA